MAKDVIIACDFPDRDSCLSFLDMFPEGKRPFVKIGMELFYSEGPDIVRAIKDRGHKVFLDLKLHDIPNTVEHAMKSIAGLGCDMVNVHAAGGIKMMEAGMNGLTEGATGAAPILIAVTQLTSTSSDMLRDELLIEKDMKEVVTEYALNARKAGLSGVVCSPLEAGMIHDACGRDFLTVTPGIRFEGDAKGDQSRITTPAKARILGSDYIVAGRSVTKADDPVLAYERAVSEFCL